MQTKRQRREFDTCFGGCEAAEGEECSQDREHAHLGARQSHCTRQGSTNLDSQNTDDDLIHHLVQDDLGQCLES